MCLSTRLHDDNDHVETGRNNEDDFVNDHDHEDNTTEADEDEQKEKHQLFQPEQPLSKE